MKEDDMVYFEIFPWNKNFETDIELIDEQHKELVNILNKLAAHLANRSGDIIMNDVFDELANYADYHFKCEEKIWFENFKDDEWSKNHKDTHGSFINEVIEIKNNKDKKPLDDVVYDVVSFLSKWLAYHILDTDKRMAIAVLQMRSGMSLEQSKLVSNEKMSGSIRVIIETVLTMYDTLSTRTLDLMREKALRQQAEEALARSDEHLQFVLDGNSNNVWDLDIENNIINQSENDVPVFEMTCNKLNNSEHKSVIHPSDIEHVKEDIQAHLDGKTEFYINKHRVIREGKNCSWVLSRGKVISRDSDGKALRMIGTHSDVTEIELAALIHKNSSQAIFIIDNNNSIININHAFTEITGYGEKESIGKNLKFIAASIHDEKLYKEIFEAIDSVGTWSGKISNKRKNGNIFTEFLEINTIKDSKGNVDYHVGMFSDITKEEEYIKEQEKQKEYLIQHSRMAQMGELISIIAHQWKQPLGAISAISANLKMDIELNTFDLENENGRQMCKKDLNDNLKTIDRMIHNLSATMDDFRHFYNPNKSSSLALISSPVTKALFIIRASLLSDGIEIQERYDCENVVLMYENEIIQVVLNILKNAKDNFKDKGIENPKISIHTKSKDGQCILEICDNGGGVPEELISKIFDPYFTTKSHADGTGLGLNMSKTIIELHHNGKIYAKNRDKGICFFIEI